MHQPGDIALTDVLLESASNGVATLMLNRPERLNALTPAVQGQMHRYFDEADADRKVRVIILTGSGAATPGPRSSTPGHVTCPPS